VQPTACQPLLLPGLLLHLAKEGEAALQHQQPGATASQVNWCRVHCRHTVNFCCIPSHPQPLCQPLWLTQHAAVVCCAPVGSSAECPAATSLATFSSATTARITNIQHRQQQQQQRQQRCPQGISRLDSSSSSGSSTGPGGLPAAAGNGPAAHSGSRPGCNIPRQCHTAATVAAAAAAAANSRSLRCCNTHQHHSKNQQQCSQQQQQQQ